MHKEIIHSDQAPKAIGPYSQGVRVNQTIYLSGQIPLNPVTMELVTDSFESQAVQVFDNITAVAKSAGETLDNIVKMTILLSDMAYFPKLNEVMSRYLKEPFPARAAYAVKTIPMNADIEIIAILAIE